MKSARRCLLALSLVAFAVPVQGADPALAARAQAILKANCQRCHGLDGTAKGGFGYILDRERLVARGKVTPGRPAESELYERIEKGEMPPARQQPRPSPADLVVLRQWIEAGAPAVEPPPGPRTFVTEADVRRLILADLQTVEPRQRRFLRYLTLTHLYNAGLPEDDLRTYRQATAKLINSLSWHPRVTVPEAIDPGRTVLRLDLRRYQWSARTWERLVTVYPYRTGDSPDSKAIAAATGTDLASLRADWFVATAARPPLYHDLLELPSSDRELERLLRVDVVKDLQEENVARAGFNVSGVSRNNRLIERHDAAFGAYWRSYDFSDNIERQNLFEHPLGPLPGPSAFEHAGGELIFNLPNGLQGYLLVNGAGRRLERAPVEVVSDPRRPDRTVEPGLSCMSCHTHGLIPKADQVRAHVARNRNAFADADVAAVRALYPPEATLRTLVREDSERFLKALAHTGVSPDDPEPVTAIALRYEAVLDLPGAAAEARLPAKEFAKRLRAARDLNRTLGPLQVPGGTVQRSTFQAAFPDLVPALHLDTPPVSVASVAVALPGEFHPFAGHTDRILCVAFSPDGRQALTGSQDETLRLWDVATGKELRRFRGHTEAVHAVAFAPDGKQVLSGGRDRTLRLWDLATGEELRRCTGHTDRVSSVAFSADGRRLLSGSWDGTVRLWDADTGKELRTFTGHEGPVSSVAVAATGKYALSGGHDGTVRLWDLQAGREQRRFTGHTREVYAVAFSPDGRRALSGGNDRTVRLWDVTNGEELHCCKGHADAVVCVAFAADGHHLLSGSSRYQGEDAPVRLWDPDTGLEQRHFGGAGSGSVWSIAFAPAGDRALSGTSENALRVWELAK